MWIVLELSKLDIHGTNFKSYVKPSLKLTKGENFDNFKVNSNDIFINSWFFISYYDFL